VPLPSRRLLAAVLAAAVAVGAAACGGSGGSSSSSSSAASAGATTTGPPITLRLGYFPNVTHAPALIGVQNGIFERALAPSRLETRTFNAGPEAVEALFSGALDASYVGPNPAINAYAKSKGAAIRIVAGSTSGGAAFVVAPSVTKAADLKGRTVASPQLGNTQDVALRAWLKEQGLSTTTSGGGDVKVTPQANADILTAFKGRKLAGAWVPEPWVTRLVQEAGGKVLVDERDEWPGGKFVTTQLVVRTAFLEQHPDAVRGLLKGHVEAVALAASGSADAKSAANAQLADLTGKPLSPAVLDAAWANLTFTVDPIASSLRTSAKHAEDLGLLEPVALDHIYDLGPLNALLRAAGKQEVKA
jgi:NitT/TauT family transport system substrate-binding protein